jgi:hypothetical protein
VAGWAAPAVFANVAGAFALAPLADKVAGFDFQVFGTCNLALTAVFAVGLLVDAMLDPCKIFADLLRRLAGRALPSGARFSLRAHIAASTTVVAVGEDGHAHSTAAARAARARFPTRPTILLIFIEVGALFAAAFFSFLAFLLVIGRLALFLGIDPGQPERGERPSEGEAAQEPGEATPGAPGAEGARQSIEVPVVHAVNLLFVDGSGTTAWHLGRGKSMTKIHYSGTARSGRAAPGRSAM